MALAGKVIQGVRWIIDSTGALVGYRNPVTDADTALSVGGGSSAWGGITGTLSVQTDLQTALDAKAPIASPTFTGIPTGPTASAGTNTTQLATTAHVLAERTNAATLTNKTLTAPVLGTPASGTLTNCTSLPVATGLSGLGTGIATALATPSAANLAAAGIASAFLAKGANVTGNFTASDGDNNKTRRVTTSSVVTLPGSLTDGWRSTFIQIGSAVVSVTAGAGTPTLLGTTTTASAGDVLTVFKSDTNEFVCKVG